MVTEEAAAVFDALGTPTRLDILAALRSRGELSVGALADALPVSRPAVSKHLRVLEHAQLVEVEVRGTQRVYRLRGSGFEIGRAYFELMWSDALASFARFAESYADD